MQGVAWRRSLGILCVLLVYIPSLANGLTRPGGDLAPLGNPDGKLNAGDVVILQRLVIGDLIPTPEQLLVGDVAPLGSPDMQLNAADLLILMRAIMGEISLSPVNLGPDAPILDTITSPTNDNPFTITGTATLGLDINLYVGSVLQSTVSASATDGSFSFKAILADGNNTVYATALDNGLEGGTSNTLTVDYINAIPRSQSGTLTQNTVWSPGPNNDPYIIVDDLTVAVGVNLILLPETRLQFDSGRSLIVDGGLKIIGSGTSPVVLTSNGAQNRGAWTGVVINPASTGSVVDNVVIEYANTALFIDRADVSITSSEIRDFSSYGIHLNNVPGSTISNNHITMTQGIQGRGINLESSSPLIEANSINYMFSGIWIGPGSSPLIRNGNEITLNTYGIQVQGSGLPESDPRPVINRNRIFNNSLSNYIVSRDSFSSGRVMLNARENWWGTADTGRIAENINDRHRIADQQYLLLKNTAMVDWRSYLDSSLGNPVIGNQLTGLLETSTVIGTGTVFDVLGGLNIPPGVRFTVEAGAELRFLGRYTKLWVEGELLAQGASGSKARFISGNVPADRTRRDWGGIVIGGPLASATIDQALIENAENGIFFYDGDGVVRNSSLKNNTSAIRVDRLNPSADMLTPAITTNDISDNDTGIYSGQAGAPVITGGNAITNNGTGIRVQLSSLFDQQLGTGVFYADPIVTGNSIYNNTVNYVAYFTNLAWNWYLTPGAAAGVPVLNARGNWWGASTVPDIAAGFSVGNSGGVDFSQFQLAPGGALYQGKMLARSVDSRTLQQDTKYEIAGDLIIPNGAVLTVPAGAELNFLDTNANFNIGGALRVQGTKENRARIRKSGEIRFEYLSSSSIDYAIIDGSNCSINFDTNVTIRNSFITNYKVNGITIASDMDDLVLIEGNVIYPDPGSVALSTGISINGSPDIRGNVIYGNTNGISLSAGSPRITAGNIITGNTRGIDILRPGWAANPDPVVNGNSIYGNSEYNYRARSWLNPGTATLDATNNWWGTADDTQIQNALYDYLDDPALSPTINYIPYQGGESVPLSISLISPVNGLITSQENQTLIIRLSRPAALTLDGVSLTPDNLVNFSYDLTLVEGDNSFVLQADDGSGTLIQQTVNLTLDTNAPNAPDAGAITLTAGTGIVTVTGAPGSVEGTATVTVTNARSGESTTAVTQPDGSFTLDIAVETGDELAIFVTDGGGQESARSWVNAGGTVPLPGAGIISPADGASLFGNAVNVTGVVQGPTNTGVTVNGIAAAVYDGQFVVNQVPLLTNGDTTIEVIATAPDGQAATQTITVTRIAASALDVDIEPDTGFAPLPVTFSVNSLTSNDISFISIDVDGDGSTDISGPDITYIYGATVTIIVGSNPVDTPVITQAVAAYTYPAPGVYTAIVHVTDADNITRTYQQDIVIESLSGMDARLRKVYSNMVEQLKAGDVPAATVSMSTAMKQKYEPELSVLPPSGLGVLAGKLGVISGGSFNQNMATYSILRDEGGILTSYRIYMIKGLDGVWRIGSM